MSGDTATLPPAGERYFEDYRAGSVYRSGPVTADRTEMAEFARLYDPQRFHLEEGEGGAAPIASGWYTVGLMMRLFVRDFLPTVASLPSPGIDELRWLAPVRAGDRLMLRLTVLDSRYSRTRPDRGIVRSRAEILNQDDEPVMTMLLTSFIAARPTTG